MARRITYTKMTLRACDVEPGDYYDGRMIAVITRNVALDDVTFVVVCPRSLPMLPDGGNIYLRYEEPVAIIRSSRLGPDTLPKDLLENLLTADQVVC